MLTAFHPQVKTTPPNGYDELQAAEPNTHFFVKKVATLVVIRDFFYTITVTIKATLDISST